MRGDTGRWRLEVLYSDKWRKLWCSDKRIELVEYAEQCGKDIQVRIVDTLEEEMENGRRNRSK